MSPRMLQIEFLNLMCQAGYDDTKVHPEAYNNFGWATFQHLLFKELEERAALAIAHEANAPRAEKTPVMQAAADACHRIENWSDSKKEYAGRLVGGHTGERK